MMTLMPARFAVFKLCADVVVFILGEINGAGGVELDAGSLVIGHSLRFRRRIHGQMILGVFGVEAG